MKRLGIIQPEKIGDIIICLPIAKWYHDRGWDVYWPVSKKLINNFIGYIDYVTFIPIESDCRYAHQTLFSLQCNRIIDLAFTIPGANTFNSDWYLNKNDSLSFDEMKYAIAEVPLEEKWNLQITRNKQKEVFLSTEKVYNNQAVFNKISYAVTQTKSSDTAVDVENRLSVEDLDILDGWHTVVEIAPATTSIFDWLHILENANEHVLIESCFSNLVDQLQIKVPEQILLLKHGYYGAKLKDGHLKGIPRLKLDWKII
jgi:hypothetical protein